MSDLNFDESAALREALLSTAASLAAAISLLERGGMAAKKAAPSDQMFDQMLADYRASLERARAALAAAPAPKPVAVDREALVEVILTAMLGRYPGRDMARAVADALLASGLRLPSQENAKLRALVQPAKDLVECWDWWTVDEYDRDRGGVSDSIEEIRTAIAALGETP